MREENSSLKGLRAIVDSVCYLEIGTRGADYVEINNALKTALCDIQGWMELVIENQAIPDYATNKAMKPNMTEFKNIINFIEKVRDTNENKLEKVIRFIEASKGLH